MNHLKTVKNGAFFVRNEGETCGFDFSEQYTKGWEYAWQMRRSEFDKALADKAEQELKRQYITRSLYGAEVVTTVTPVDRNRVKLTFTVSEGGPSKIKEIRINELTSLGDCLALEQSSFHGSNFAYF